MARLRTLEASTFVLVLGALLAYSSTEATSSVAPRRCTSRRRPWLPVSFPGNEAEVGLTAKQKVPGLDQQAVLWEDDRLSRRAKVIAGLRGGRSMRQEKEEDQDDPSTAASSHEDQAARIGDDQDSEEQENVPYDEKAVEWMMQQLCMYQTRTALLATPLASKGFKLREIVPSPRGLICAMSTDERRMGCRMYVEAEVGKKVVAPCKCKGTQKWISLSALNSERRRETAKWKQCPVCQAPIDYKIYEAYGGGLGKTVSAVLNNAGGIRTALAIMTVILFMCVSPVVHIFLVRLLTSSFTWRNYHRLAFILHMPLPLQIMVIRFVAKWTYDQVLSLENMLRRRLTDVESQILESRLPVTVEVLQDGEEVAVAHPRP